MQHPPRQRLSSNGVFGKVARRPLSCHFTSKPDFSGSSNTGQRTRNCFAGRLLQDKVKGVQMTLIEEQPHVVVRTAVAKDSEVCGQICYDAFSAINAAHGFPCDFPGSDVTTGLLAMMFSSPDFYCVVAESDGRILGSNALDERCIIRGVGPITIDPTAQNLRIGRKLMQAVIDRANQSGAAGIRLVQAAFHNRSLSLYTSLGFDVREPLSCMQGRTRERSISGCAVRAAQPADQDACNALSRQVQGFDRGVELRQAIQQGTAAVVERGHRITGYTTNLALFGHSTAETNPDMQIGR